MADTLGTMKGVLMKIGQLASYVDDGLAPPARRVLGRLQDSVPPMSPELAAEVIVAELGDAPERCSSEWDPLPIAAASIGQVHRAITADGRAVAVKVQYPGIAETIAADLGNVALIRSLLKMAVPSQDVTSLIEELRERIGEELDYLREAENQRLFAAYFDGHPTASVPKIVDELSTARVITSELAAGARFAEMLDLAAGGEGPGGGDDLPLHLPLAVRAVRVQRRPAPGQLPVRAGRAGHVPRLRAGEALHAR